MPEGTHRVWLTPVQPILHQNWHPFAATEVGSHRALCLLGVFPPQPLPSLNNLIITTCSGDHQKKAYILDYVRPGPSPSPSSHCYRTMALCISESNPMPPPAPTPQTFVFKTLSVISKILYILIFLSQTKSHLCCIPLPIFHKCIGSAIEMYQDSPHLSGHSRLQLRSKLQFSESNSFLTFF